MKQIIYRLPQIGRLSYESENMMFLKNKINYLIDLIIKQDEKTNAVYKSFMTLILDKDLSIKRMCEESKIDPNKVILLKKYESDIYRRLGNQVIQSVIDLSRQIRLMDFKTENRLAKKRIQRKKIDFLIQESLYLSEKVQREAMSYFNEHMKTLEEMKIKVLIEQGVIEI